MTLTQKQKRARESYLRNRDRVLARSKAWAQANPEKVRAAKKKYVAADPERAAEQFRRAVRKAAGVTHPTGERRAGPCDICDDFSDPLCLDHDHSTGQIRGWLCHNCNKALGLLRDNPARLRRAITYLESATYQKTR
jgi:hypothetical protein